MFSCLALSNGHITVKRTIRLGMALMLPLIIFGCTFPANVKEASKRQMELIEQTDQAALDYEKTVSAVIDAVRGRYLDGQAKAVALKESERLMAEGRSLSSLSEELRQAMEKAKREEDVLRSVQGLSDMKTRNSRNYQDYRRYLKVTKAMHGVLDAYISTDVAPEDKDVETLKKAVKDLAK